jgi:fluoride ion exporter CrcB/FEX
MAVRPIIMLQATRVELCRMACSGIIGALNTTSTAVVEVKLLLDYIDLPVVD